MSSKPNSPTVAAISPASNLWLTRASAPTTFTSSPTQLLIAEGVMVSATAQLGPSCSSEIGG